jgi:hypothetical protein
MTPILPAAAVLSPPPLRHSRESPPPHSPPHPSKGSTSPGMIMDEGGIQGGGAFGSTDATNIASSSSPPPPPPRHARGRGWRQQRFDPVVRVRLRLQWRPKTIQRSGRGGDDDSRRQQIESTINKQCKVEGRGGYREMTRRGTRINVHNNQTDHAEGG